MTRRTNARLAGFTFLLYIMAGITHMMLFSQATGSAEGTPATLASIAQHASLVSVTIILTLFEAACALVLGVTLHALTCDVDPDLAMLGLCFRVGEGVITAFSSVRLLVLLSVAAVAAGVAGPDAVAANALGGLLLRVGGMGTISSILFAAGSMLFCFLFLRARSIPVQLAWLGLLASVTWVIGFPLQLMGFLGGPVTYFMWIPMALFEVTFAFWLLLKGVATPAIR